MAERRKHGKKSLLKNVTNKDGGSAKQQRLKTQNYEALKEDEHSGGEQPRKLPHALATGIATSDLSNLDFRLARYLGWEPPPRKLAFRAQRVTMAQTINQLFENIRDSLRESGWVDNPNISFVNGEKDENAEKRGKIKLKPRTTYEALASQLSDLEKNHGDPYTRSVHDYLVSLFLGAGDALGLDYWLVSPRVNNDWYILAQQWALQKELAEKEPSDQDQEEEEEEDDPELVERARVRDMKREAMAKMSEEMDEQSAASYYIDSRAAKNPGRRSTSKNSFYRNGEPAPWYPKFVKSLGTRFFYPGAPEETGPYSSRVVAALITAFMLALKGAGIDAVLDRSQGRIASDRGPEFLAQYLKSPDVEYSIPLYSLLGAQNEAERVKRVNERLVASGKKPTEKLDEGDARILKRFAEQPPPSDAVLLYLIDLALVGDPQITGGEPLLVPPSSISGRKKQPQKRKKRVAH